MRIPQIADATTVEGGVVVRLEGLDKPLELTWRWLRDHSEDPSSLDPRTRQRLVDTFALADGLTARLDAVTAHELRFAWDDGPALGVVSATLLASVAGLLAPPAPELWGSRATIDALPVLSHDAVMTSDAGLGEWLVAIARFGFAVVDGVPPSPEGAEALARRIGYPRMTIFGDMWPLSAELREHDDSAYDTTALEPHTDSTYVHDAPGLQSFVCLERTGTGGESVLVDGFAAVETLRVEDPAAFDLLARVAVPGRYLEPGVHLATQRPTIRVDRQGRVVQVSFNNYDRAPFLLPPTEMEAFYRAYRTLHELICDRSRWIDIGLTAGMALTFDNWRVLHGRQGFTGRRVFHGCYHNREDFESRLRVLGLAP